MRHPLLKQLLKIALPLMAGNFVQTLYNLTDTFFLGKLGADELSAPTIAFPIILFFILFGIGLSMAGTTLIAQAKGKRDQERVNFYLGQTTLILTVTSIGIAAAGILLAEPLLHLMQTPESVFAFTRDYMVIIFTGMPFMFGFFILQASMQGIGRTMVPLALQAAMVALNIALDPLFIFGIWIFPAWGVRGAAVATVIARGLSSIVAFRILVKGNRGMQLTPSNLRPDRAAIRLFLKIGLPSSMGQAVTALGFTVLQGLVNIFGSAVIAAFGVANRIISLFHMPAMGISRATTTLVGQSLGARQVDQAKLVVRLSILSILAFLIPAALFTFFFGGSFIRFFVDDAETIRYGSILFRIVSPSVVVFGIVHAVLGAFQGAGDTKPVMHLNISRLWLFRLPLAYLFAVVLAWGPMGIWWAMFLSNILTAAAGLFWYSRGKWITALDPDTI
ncbi:MAG: MATE family efflux transporter [Spirochaetaceae bacterium]